jgi:signal transduction histidine kinase/phage shock protein PspC (stress-responsive transcriptional regulator)
MAQPVTSPGSPTRSAPGAVGRVLLRRSDRDRVVAGVAGGLGELWGIDPVILRLAFVALATAGGAGVLAYLGAWLVSVEPDARSEAGEPPTSTLQQTVAVALVVLGILLLLRTLGVWFDDALVWPVSLAVLGSALIWTRGDEAARRRWAVMAQRIPGVPGRLLAGKVSPGRLLAGSLLIATGMALFLAANDAVPALRSLAFAVAVSIAGAGLILGPGVMRLIRQLSQERRERIRSEERAEVAAHLHDSVLQALALIQRSDSKQDAARLARAQERELRAWLYGRTSADGEMLSRALEDMAARVEAMHDVAVETVVVGDVPMDEQLRAVVLACGEAVTNGAKHSGAGDVSVYIEVEPASITAFVRDQGQGFDPFAVPDDRRGIAESIVGRMERSGGEASIVSRPDEGVEVRLSLPRRQG